MGNGINNYMSLIANLAKSSAAMQNDKEKIDTKAELNSYVSGWDAIKKDAEAKNNSGAQIDISTLEVDMKSELASLMGAEFGKSAGVEAKDENGKPVFSAEDISLENMMKLLAPGDGLNIDKLREYNDKPILSKFEEIKDIEVLNKAGFDSELLNIISDQEPGAIKYMTDAVNNGSADRIANTVGKLEALMEADEAETLKKAEKDATDELNNNFKDEKKKKIGDKLMNSAPEFKISDTEEEDTKVAREATIKELRDMFEKEKTIQEITKDMRENPDSGLGA